MEREPVADHTGKMFLCGTCKWFVERSEIVTIIDSEGYRVQCCLDCMRNISRVVKDYQQKLVKQFTPVEVTGNGL